MKTRTRDVLAALALPFVLWLVPAQDAAAKKPSENRILLSPDESEPSVRRGDQRVSTLTGAPLALYRVGYRVGPGTPEEMARQFLRENWQLLHLQDPDLGDLQHHATREGLASTTVRFRQHVDGVPVYKAEVTVTIDHHNVVTFVMNGYKPAKVGSTVPGIAAAEARQAALDFVGVADDLLYETTELVVYHNRGASRLAHRVVFYPLGEPRGEWEVLRDAETGEIFKATDVACYAPVNGDGDVFDPDPLSSAGATYGQPGYVDGSDASTPELQAEIFNRALLDIDLTGGIHTLVGPWAELVDAESPFKGLFPQASSSFLSDRFGDLFEAANTYYHVDTYMRYVNLTLGVSVMPFQYSGGVRFDPHGLGGADNSHYTGAGLIAFGEGGVDDAEDADVVIHELGHGLHDWLTSGGLSQVNGLSEGFGDYVAQSYSRSFGHWDPSDPQYHWVFNWDGHNPFWGGRITNYGAIYPGGLTGQIHTDGQIWSTCNMRIWDEIGREAIDTAMFEGLAMTNGGTNQEDAAQAVLEAALAMGYSVAQLTAMQTIYQSCGYDVMVELEPPLFADGFESGDTSAWN